MSLSARGESSPIGPPVGSPSSLTSRLARRAFGSTPLVVRTVTLADPGPLLALLPQRDSAEDADALVWVRRGEGLIGWGEAARCDVGGPQRMAHAAAWWSEISAAAMVRDDVGLPGCGPVAFGSFAFDDEPGHSVLVVPEIIVGRRGNAWWLTTISADGSLPATPELTQSPAPTPTGAVVFSDGATSGAEWEGVVAQAVARITEGHLEKVVLARDLVATADSPVDIRGPLHRLAAAYDGCWTFHVDGLLGSTPEMLVRLEKGLVTSRVLAGTIRRTGDDTHDLALAASLARSSKDLEEHEYAVRSVADALAPSCSSMNVPETPFVLHLPNVMHLASDVTAVLSEATSALHLVAALHPSAAVCGTPTPAARALIRELEGMQRGRYAGPVGWIDASGDGEWGLALRCAERSATDPRQLRLFAGCGIVAGSDPAAELAEAAAKFVPVRDALTQG